MGVISGIKKKEHHRGYKITKEDTKSFGYSLGKKRDIPNDRSSPGD